MKMCILASLILFSSHTLLTIVSTQNIAISCGSSGNSTALDGRLWIGDSGRTSSSPLQITGNSRAINQSPSTSPDHAPYETARASRQEFSYVFSVEPGQKFVRLHFNRVTHRGFEHSTPQFTVKAGPYTLLTNFSPALTPISKEYCFNTDDNSREFTITFTPSQRKLKSDNFYAFVNGIEVVPMPTGLYFTPEGESGPLVVGHKYRFYIDNTTALELVQRLNIGGDSLSEDSTMFRTWENDSNYLTETDSVSVSVTSSMKIYRTERKPRGSGSNLTWTIPVDLGFRYLIRLHIDPESGHTDFTIVVNNHTSFIEPGGKSGVPAYLDYIVMMEGDKMAGKQNLSVAFNGTAYGLEVFKLSNPDNSLAGVEQVPVLEKPRKKKESSSIYDVNFSPTVLTVTLALLNIAVYNLARILGPKSQARRMSNEHPCRRFSIGEIRSATDDFDSRLHIGRGGYGNVYRGRIDGGSTMVAIKRSRLGAESRQGDTQFWTEVKMLSRIRHVNLVPLVGYCNDGHERALVYQYMARGTLADHLYKINRKRGKSNPSLDWELRLKISIGAAHGLYYLHSRHRVIHRDVKSSNILLDGDWSAKISDFGLSKMGPTNDSFTHISTNVKGTFGYLDPEYFLTRKLTRKSDVYAFGVVLFEVLSGRPAVDIGLEEEQHSLGGWARYCIREGKVDRLIDQNLTGQISPACLKVFLGVAGRCLHTQPQGRPAMADVVVGLELALALQNTDSTDQIEGEENAGKTYSDQSDGMMSLMMDDMSLTPPKGESDRISTVEDNNLASSSSSRGRIKGRDRKNPKPKPKTVGWWWDFFGIFTPRKPSNPPLPRKVIIEYSFLEIQKATNNFHNSLIIGCGGLDNVYKGFIDNDNKAVTIRRSRSTESRVDMAHQLQSEKEIQKKSSPGEDNYLAVLIGYCETESEMILMYEHTANGTFYEHLHEPFRDPLPWKRRLQISIGAARGIIQIHCSVKQTMLHRDFRSTNIWLDENWVPRVSRWGLSRYVESKNRETRNVKAKWEHLDSDYVRGEGTTEKSYVYSFGLVLFELLFADRESDRWCAEDQVSLALWIKSCMRNDLLGCIDPFLEGRVSPDSLKIVVETAGRCLLDYGNDRPSMAEIVTRLEEALKLQEAMEGNTSRT